MLKGFSTTPNMRAFISFKKRLYPRKAAPSPQSGPGRRQCRGRQGSCTDRESLVRSWIWKGVISHFLNNILSRISQQLNR